MMNFIAQSMRRFGLAPDNKVKPSNVTGTRAAASRSPIAHMMIGSKWSKTTLQYPLDIQGRSDQGHYMKFYINETVNVTPHKKGKTPTMTPPSVYGDDSWATKTIKLHKKLGLKGYY